MKRWAILTVFIYLAALVVLMAPVYLVAFGNWGLKPQTTTLQDMLEMYANPVSGIWLAILLAGQSLLLLLPIRIAERRLPARRPLKIPVLVTAFFLALLLLAGILSVLCAIFKDDGFGFFDLRSVIILATNSINHLPTGSTGNSGWQDICGLLVPVLVFWLIWAVIFRRATRAEDPQGLLKRALQWLVRGSILELIIAVPSHVIVRRRDDCCAPAGTFWGIATGISVMLLCFGPGVYFLFVQRMQKLKPGPRPPRAPFSAPSR
jgi:hypothetical protein